MGAARKLKVATKPNDNMDGELRRYTAGSRLVTENEYSRKMFIIKKGKVRVSKDYMGQRVTLAILGEGEVFGELSFFDSAPRSASVDALTDLEVVVIDGKQAHDQIANLPSWVVPIFRTVFHRFREADQKITVLQSMNEFQKKVLLTDGVAKSIYMELMRFIRTLELLYSRSRQLGGPVNRDSIYKELDDVLGKRVIGLTVFWKVLRENDFMDAGLEDKSGEVVINEANLQNWKKYLAREMETERFMFLSFSAMAVLRRIMGKVFEQIGPETPSSDAEMIVPLDELKIHSMPLHREGLEEMAKSKIIETDGETISFVPAKLIEAFNFQTLLKAFDHTVVNLD